ncbi:hypothetical protein ACFVZR_19705 [Streptomyces sp. NPDC058316]|uniref:hypothetical protein n=1 Tax=unclassified Streptomyces TaxID=2593676 RepID=UPI00331EE372
MSVSPLACAVHRRVALVLVSMKADTRERQRTIMQRLYGCQLDAHVRGAGAGVGLISCADLASSAPLLRATYRNRGDARIHEVGMSGDALHTMLRTRMGEADGSVGVRLP